MSIFPSNTKIFESAEEGGIGVAMKSFVIFERENTKAYYVGPKSLYIYRGGYYYGGDWTITERVKRFNSKELAKRTVKSIIKKLSNPEDYEFLIEEIDTTA